MSDSSESKNVIVSTKRKTIKNIECDCETCISICLDLQFLREEITKFRKINRGELHGNSFKHLKRKVERYQSICTTLNEVYYKHQGHY